MGQDKPLIDTLPRKRIYPVGPDSEDKPRKHWFSDANCQHCTYKATNYCWNNCSINVWKERRDY